MTCPVSLLQLARSYLCNHLPLQQKGVSLLQNSFGSFQDAALSLSTSFNDVTIQQAIEHILYSIIYMCTYDEFTIVVCIIVPCSVLYE